MHLSKQMKHHWQKDTHQLLTSACNEIACAPPGEYAITNTLPSAQIQSKSITRHQKRIKS